MPAVRGRPAAVCIKAANVPTGQVGTVPAAAAIRLISILAAVLIFRAAAAVRATANMRPATV